MAALRPVEERDARGNTIRVNPAITYKQDRQFRVIVGRHDWRLEDNAEYHPPITAQVQNGKIVFFNGVPDTTKTREAAKEMKQSDVPQYILDGLRSHPIKIREPRPTVYEVRLAIIGDVEVAQATEVDTNGADALEITPVAPALERATSAGPEASL
jgi:hypothetical protein